MANRAEEPLTFSKFSGLRNNVPKEEFGLTDLTVASNVDLNDSGVLSRRNGFGTPAVAGSYHSLWSGAGVCLAVSGTTLYRIQPGYTATAIRTGLTSGRRMAYSAVGARAYYSNGVETGVVENGTSRTWGIVPPGRINAVATAGSLRAGRYQFALTFVRNDGQESGASIAGVLELAGIGGLSFSALPVSSDPSISTKRLYVSKPNGETLFLQAEITNTTISLDVMNEGFSTIPLRSQHLSAAPAGDILGVYNGRILSAKDGALRYSEPYAYELFDPRGVLHFESAIRMIAPVSGGIYVGSDNATIYLQGDDLARSTLVEKASYGVVPGTLAYVQASSFGDGSQVGNLAIWASHEGLCAGADGGTFRNLTQDRFAYPKQAQGAALFRQHRGMNQYITVLQGTETQGNIYT